MEIWAVCSSKCKKCKKIWKKHKCKNVIKRVSIDDSLLNEDRDMLEDLIAAALNDTLRKAETTATEHMGALTNGMQLPPGFKMPF